VKAVFEVSPDENGHFTLDMSIGDHKEGTYGCANIKHVADEIEDFLDSFAKNIWEEQEDEVMRIQTRGGILDKPMDERWPSGHYLVELSGVSHYHGTGGAIFYRLKFRLVEAPEYVVWVFVKKASTTTFTAAAKWWDLSGYPVYLGKGKHRMIGKRFIARTEQSRNPDHGVRHAIKEFLAEVVR
jgi:hypothetical protein